MPYDKWNAGVYLCFYFFFREFETGTVIHGGGFARHLSCTHFFQSFFGTETTVGFAFFDQFIGIFAVNFGSFGLDVWSQLASRDWAFVVIQTEHFERGDEIFHGSFHEPFLISVFNSKDHDPFVFSGKKVIKEGCAKASDMDISGWGWSKSGSDH